MRNFIPPHQSPTAPASPQGEAFLQESFRATRQGDKRRSHPSPAATNCLQSSLPKGKPFCKSLFVLHDKAVSKSIYTPLIPLLQRQTACSLLPLRGNLFARVFSATRQGDKRKHLHTPSSSPAATNRLQSSPPKGKPFCKSLFCYTTRR